MHRHLCRQVRNVSHCDSAVSPGNGEFFPSTRIFLFSGCSTIDQSFLLSRGHPLAWLCVSVCVSQGEGENRDNTRGGCGSPELQRLPGGQGSWPPAHTQCEAPHVQAPGKADASGQVQREEKISRKAIREEVSLPPQRVLFCLKPSWGWL